MGISYKLVEILKLISIVILLGIPPWLTLSRYMKSKVNGIVWGILFVIYLVGTVFTQNIFPFIVVLIVLSLISKNKNDDIYYYFRPIGRDKKNLIFASIIFKFLTIVVTGIFVSLLIKLGFEVKPQDISNLLLKANGVKMLILICMTVIIAPILEEFIFRHIIYRELSNKIGRRLACILSSILFMVLHFYIEGSIGIFLVGVYNCYLYDRYGYRAAVLNHFIFNFTSVLSLILLGV